MDIQTAIEFIAANKVVFTLAAAGLFGPAIISLVVALLNLPYVRNLVGGFCFLGGKWVSMFLIRRLGESGRKLEDAFQSFIKDVVVGRFFAGLDADDK